MSIGAIANIISTSVAARDTRPESVADHTLPKGSPPPVDGELEDSQPDAAVTTLSDEALALQAADERAAREAAAEGSVSALTSVIYLEWVPGATAETDGAAVQEALNALTEASRENLDTAVAAAFTAAHDQAALEQKAIDDVAALVVQQRDATALFALNAEIRLAYGGLPSPGTGDPVLREPGQLDVLA